jgi:DNA-binding LytR/AlgR family response regulator
LRDNTVDLIFLDIHLPKLKGLAFLKTLTRPPAVIITTAYNQYAVEGFNLNVTDYLLKPFEFERFLVAVNKVKSNQSNVVKSAAAESDEVTTDARKDYLFVNIQKKKVKILFDDILYIESQREYVKIVTTKKEYLSKISTHEIESLLPGNLFKRVHRSFIISLDKLESYTADEVEVNGVSIPVGREYRNVLDTLSR